MAKQKLRIRAARLEPELNKRVERATREGGFSNPSAFIRGAIERELVGRESGVEAAEDRLAASLDRLSREIRGVKLTVSFAVVNDGVTVADPEVGSSHLFVNGAEPWDWNIVINNGLRTLQFTALPPGEVLSFSYQLGPRYFATPGIYVLRWQLGTLQTVETTFRVLPRRL